jgi:hypothetical protein
MRSAILALFTLHVGCLANVHPDPNNLTQGVLQNSGFTPHYVCRCCVDGGADPDHGGTQEGKYSACYIMTENRPTSCEHAWRLPHVAFRVIVGYQLYTKKDGKYKPDPFAVLSNGTGNNFKHVFMDGKPAFINTKNGAMIIARKIQQLDNPPAGKAAELLLKIDSINGAEFFTTH